MQALPNNAEDVIKKWQTHSLSGEDSGIIIDEFKNLPKKNIESSEERFATRRARRKLKSKTNENAIVSEIAYMQKKFRLQPTVLRDELPNYECFACKYCKDALSVPKKTSNNHSKTLDLFDIKDVKIRNNSNEVSVVSEALYETSISSFMTRSILPTLFSYAKNIFGKICYQSEDQMQLNKISKEKMLFVHENGNIWRTLLAYLYIISTMKQVPFTLVDSSLIASGTLRWLMRKIGFVFVSKDMSDAVRSRLSQDLAKVMHTTCPYILLSLPTNYEMMSEYANIFKDLIVETKVNKLWSNLQLVPLHVSYESDPTRSLSTSSFGKFLLGETPYHSTTIGLVEINIAQPISLKSLLNAASEMLPPTPEEEFNIIARNLRHVLLNSSAIFPSHILSFLLLYKHEGDSISIDVLGDSYKKMLDNLADANRIIGYVGKTDVAIKHAIEVLKNQNLITSPTSDTITITTTSNISNSQTLHQLALPIIQSLMMDAIIACSVITCIGGEAKLMQGNNKKITLTKNEIAEKVTILAEFISYILDFFCPLTEVENVYDELFSEMQMLKLVEESYENQRHQKLVENIDIASKWDDEEDDYGFSKQESISYEISIDEEFYDSAFSSRLIRPYMELYFTIVLILKDNFKGDEIFTVARMYDCLKEAFVNGAFLYGEVVSVDYISRVFDYLYEKGVIDESNDTSYVLSCDYQDNRSNFNELLTTIFMFI